LAAKLHTAAVVAGQGTLERLKHHGVAVLFVLLAFGLTLGLQAVASRAYYILFVPAVMFATWFGGLAAGLTASVATVVLTVAFLLPSGTIVDQLAWVIVAGAIAVATSTLVARRRVAEARLATLLAEEQGRRGEADSQNERKSAFLAQVAHELRQPLGAISTATGLLEGANVSPAAKDRALGVITRQTEHLRRLVDDLLDLSRMTRDDLHLRKVNVDICDVVEDCCHSIEPDANGRGIRFVSSVPDCPVTIHADATRMRQIVLNLLTNAVKFTEPGGEVQLVVEQQPLAVVIRVSDTGRGISADRLSTIFDMFQTGGEDGGGLGIGLAVVKGLTEVHGGTVRATSPGPGRGSEFIVTLPLDVRPAA
jgi:signal transduction histidine kinase